MKCLFLAAWILTQTTGVAVRGKVIRPPGQQSGTEPAAVTMSGADRNELKTAPVAADGGFEFLNVERGIYVLSPKSNVAGLPSVMIKVDDKDISGIELRTPRTVTVTGRVTVEGGGPIPRFWLSLSGVYGNTGVEPTPAQDGTFRVTVVEGEHEIRVTRLPASYSVKSMTYGSANLLTEKLKITASDPQSIAITLATTTPPRGSGGVSRVAAFRLSFVAESKY